MALLLFEGQKDTQLNPLPYRIFVTVQYLHLTSPIEREETFFPRPWWEGLGEGGELIRIFITILFGLPLDGLQ